jgi:hypothetical protein
MVAAITIRSRKAQHEKHSKVHSQPSAAIDQAVRIIHAVCGLAGSSTLIDDKSGIATPLLCSTGYWPL